VVRRALGKIRNQAYEEDQEPIYLKVPEISQSLRSEI